MQPQILAVSGSLHDRTSNIGGTTLCVLQVVTGHATLTQPWFNIRLYLFNCFTDFSQHWGCRVAGKKKKSDKEVFNFF